MKQFTLKSLMLLLLLLIGGGSFAWGETWIRCTSVSDLISGGTFILGFEATANSGIIVPMQCSGTATATTAGYLNGGTEKTTGKNTVDMSNVTETSKYEVTIGASSIADGTVSIKCGDYFVGNNDEKNKLKLFSTETENTAFTPSVGKNDVFTLTLAACKTYNKLQYNTSSPRFACYGGTQKDVVIYKKNDGGDNTASLKVNTTSVDFGTVEQNAAVDAKTVSVSLKNVTSANVKLTGEGASAFEVSSSVLTASGDVTITPKTTSVGTYTAKLEISADGAETQSVDVLMTVEKPFDGGVWEIKGTDLKILNEKESSLYDKYKGDQSKLEIIFNVQDVLSQTGLLQFRKSSGTLYNKTPFSNIIKIELETSTPDVFAVYVGKAEYPITQEVEGTSANGVVTFDFPEGNDYFTIKNKGTSVGRISSIKVYYSISPSPSEPTYTPNTLTFKASNKEGHWATFSNDDVTFFYDNVIVNTVVVENNSLESLSLDKTAANIEGKEVKGYYVPAKTGVLINSLDETVTYYVVKNKEVEPVDGDINMLKPASEQMTEGFKFYKLAYDNFTEKTGLGFYWGAADGGKFVVKPGLAYLAVPQAQVANVKGFSFDGTQTGINGVEATAAKGAIYNLNGQRVEKAQRGIYIQNGKKFIVK